MLRLDIKLMTGCGLAGLSRHTTYTPPLKDTPFLFSFWEQVTWAHSVLIMNLQSMFHVLLLEFTENCNRKVKM